MQFNESKFDFENLLPLVKIHGQEIRGKEIKVFQNGPC